MNPYRDCSYQTFRSIQICSDLFSLFSHIQSMIGGPNETLHLQALCTLGDCVRRTPRMQSAAQMMPMAQTICTMRQKGSFRIFQTLHTSKHSKIDAWSVLMFQAKHCAEFGHILAVSKHALEDNIYAGRAAHGDSTKKPGGTPRNQFNRASI